MGQSKLLVSSAQLAPSVWVMLVSGYRSFLIRPTMPFAFFCSFDAGRMGRISPAPSFCRPGCCNLRTHILWFFSLPAAIAPFPALLLFPARFSFPRFPFTSSIPCGLASSATRMGGPRSIFLPSLTVMGSLFPCTHLDVTVLRRIRANCGAYATLRLLFFGWLWLELSILILLGSQYCGGILHWWSATPRQSFCLRWGIVNQALWENWCASCRLGQGFW